MSKITTDANSEVQKLYQEALFEMLTLYNMDKMEKVELGRTKYRCERVISFGGRTPFLCFDSAPHVNPETGIAYCYNCWKTFGCPEVHARRQKVAHAKALKAVSLRDPEGLQKAKDELVSAYRNYTSSKAILAKLSTEAKEEKTFIDALLAGTTPSTVPESLQEKKRGPKPGPRKSHVTKKVRRVEPEHINDELLINPDAHVDNEMEVDDVTSSSDDLSTIGEASTLFSTLSTA